MARSWAIDSRNISMEKKYSKKVRLNDILGSETIRDQFASVRLSNSNIRIGQKFTSYIGDSRRKNLPVGEVSYTDSMKIEKILDSYYVLISNMSASKYSQCLWRCLDIEKMCELISAQYGLVSIDSCFSKRAIHIGNCMSTYAYVELLKDPESADFFERTDEDPPKSVYVRLSTVHNSDSKLIFRRKLSDGNAKQVHLMENFIVVSFTNSVHLLSLNEGERLYEIPCSLRAPARRIVLACSPRWLAIECKRSPFVVLIQNVNILDSDLFLPLCIPSWSCKSRFWLYGIILFLQSG